MQISMLQDFCRRMKQTYRLKKVSIYGLIGGMFTLIAGETLPEILLAEYRTYTTPKYIAREDDGDLILSPGTKSRFVWHTTLARQPFLVALDSGTARAFDNTYMELLREIRMLKEALNR